jgi:hypothetical protein
MNARIGILTLLVVLGLIASWMLGYYEGQQVGAVRLAHDVDAPYDRAVQDDINKGRDQVCGEIKSYKLSIAADLENNTQICDFPDLDSSNNSK